MTPKPPSSSEGSPLPPRSRPNLDDFVKDTTELDLWSFDDADPPPPSPAKPSSRSASPSIPVPRETGKKKKPPEPDDSFPTKIVGIKNSVRVNVSKERPKAQSGTTAGGQSKPGKDFDDLDHWDTPEQEPPVLEIHPSFASTPVVPAAPEETVAEEPADEPPASEIPQPAAPAADEVDEFSPVARENAVPVSLVPHLGLSKIERIGLFSLLGILLIAGVMVFINTIHRLPTETERVRSGDFPVKGRYISILSAETFWRAPISEGANAETFRRGTQLLPVVNLTSSGGPAAIRVFFRDHDGVVMGDAVTRLIRPGVPLQVAATAGFEDVGMHAAYRTGQSKPWTIEVHEAPSEASPITDFKKLFEINISTDRR